MKYHSKGLVAALILLTILLVDWICPVQALTGLPCPGCMMTTAAYYLIQFDIETALYFNPAILIVFVGFILLFLFRKKPKMQKVIFWVIVMIWMLTYMIRMMTVFPHWPMEYQYDSLFGIILKEIRG